MKRYSGVLVKCNDKVLLCKRNATGSFPGMWSLPGGKVEKEESTKEAAYREFFEETAIDIDDEELKFIGLIPRHTRDGLKVKGMMYVYQLDVKEEIYPDLEEAIDGEEHTDAKYFDVSEISEKESGSYLSKLLKIILTQ